MGGRASSLQSTSLIDIPLSPKLSQTDKDNLRIGQKRMTEMLRVFDKICVDNGITYFAIGGTLLGTRVYQGWIPWDGDLDIEILKSDWPKLNKLLQTQLPPTMWLQTEETDTHYNSWYPNMVKGKIRDLHSCYKHCQDGQRFHNGFMLDLNLFYVEPGTQKIVMEDNRAQLNAQDIFPIQRAKFDTITINIPRNPDKYLQGRYKPSNPDYMVPIEERYPHEGFLDPHHTCDHHYDLYPHMYKREGK